MGLKKGFSYVCIVVQKFWSLYMTPLFSYLVLLLSSFVKAARKLRREKEKDRDTFRLKFYLGGYDYSVEMEYFPEPVEIAVLSRTRRLKNIIESFLASYKFDVSPCVSVFSGYV